MRSRSLIRIPLFVLISCAFGLAGCSSSDSSGPSAEQGTPSAKVTLTGVVATGAAIKSASVSIRDKNGQKTTGTTDTNGKYTADVSGFTAPFLLKVASGDSFLYSVATAAGTANIHPFTDMIVRNWYKVGGQDVDTVFAATTADPNPPTPTGIATIETVVRQIIATNMRGADVDTSNFNLLTTSFDANSSGFDLVLDNLQVKRENGSVIITSTGGGASTPLVSIAENTVLTTLVTPPSSTVTDTAAPSVPAGLAATRTAANQVVLSWTVSTDAVGVAGYKLFRNGTQIGIIDQAFFVDGSAPATGAAYTVAAYDQAGNKSAQSSSVPASDSLAAADTQAPSAPVLTATVVSTSQVDLSWEAAVDNNSVSGYKVFANGVALATTTGITYSATSLTAGAIFHFKVLAFDASGNATPSNVRPAATHVGLAGAWRTTLTDGSFSYLVLAKDNTFYYAENDLTVQHPEFENGLEAGTYSYDSSTQKITFSVTYDDNTDDGINGQSGVGSIGTPSVVDAVMSAGRTKLTLAGGNLVLDYVPAASQSLVGVWRHKNGADFSVLALFSDGKFFYAENDTTVQHPEFENGLEAGTYTYDASAGTATFTVAFDDNTSDEINGPSGVGSIGTPSILTMSLSNGNNTLTTANGNLVLDRMFGG